MHISVGVAFVTIMALLLFVGAPWLDRKFPNQYPEGWDG